MRIQKAELAAKLNRIKGVVPKKTNRAILQGILVKDGYLTATNLEMTVRAKIGDTAGECFIIPERAFDLINSLPDGEVDVSATAGNTITIRSARIKNKYQAMDPEQFPVTGGLKGENHFTIKAGILMESIKRVSYAVLPQTASTVMSSVCLQAAGGTLNFVGMDGHMMAWDKVDYDGEFELLDRKSVV